MMRISTCACGLALLLLIAGSTSAQITPVSLDVRVASGNDDAEESSSGSMYLDSSDLELTYDGSDQVVGLRFAGVQVPAGALITRAHVQLVVDETSSTTTVLSIRGEAADRPAAFSSSARDISARPRTAAAVSWAPAAWSSVGAAGAEQRTPDLTTVIQEIVGRPGWAAGNPIALIVTGSGRRVARAREAGSGGAALLHLEFVAAAANAAPSVSAGPDRAVVLPPGEIVLEGFASDDGRPDPPAALSLQWSQVSGPSPVLLSGASSASVAASFTEPGAYVLRLTADDGALASSDDVAVTVDAAGTAAVEARVASGSDDAEESPAGLTTTSSTDLELVYDGGDQVVGMRFASLSIPQGALITRAHVQFQVDEPSSTLTRLTIQAEASDRPAAFSASSGNISSRPRTAASVLWTPPAWSTEGAAGADQRTPDLAAVIQEVVDRPGWAPGQALVLIVRGTGERVAEAYEGSRAAAPLLHVEYGGGGGAAEADEIHWTFSGPGEVTFNWRGAADTLSYGTASGLLTSTVAAAAPSPLPGSSAGPFREARLTGLAEDTLHHYRIGGGPERTFRTPPARGSSGFWLAEQGGIGGPPAIHPLAATVQAQVASDLAAIPGDDRPRFVLVAGDLAYDDQAGPAAVDDHFNAVMAWSRTAAYMPAWGEREADRDEYEGRFTFPNSQDSPGAPAAGGPGEEWMWFDYGNARFISYPEPFAGAWEDWAARADVLMQEAQADPAIAFVITWGHRPAWSSGSDHAGSAELHAILAGLRSRHGKYVMNIGAHSSHYERTVPSLTGGLVHIVGAGGGATLGGVAGSRPSWSAFRMNHLAHVRLNVLADRIEGYAVCGPDGAEATEACEQDTVTDRWTILAGGGTPVNQPPQGVITSPAGAVTLAAGQSFNFQSSALDPDGHRPLSFRWDFGGGAAVRTVEDPGLVSFSTPGTYTVTLTVTDALGLSDPTPDRRLVTVVSASTGRTLHAAPGGSDAGDGSLAAPFRTIGHAASRLQPGDTLLLRGGTYHEAPSIGVSGTATAPITIRSYPGEQAVLDSGPREFRSPGNQDWELVDAARGEYRSVRTFGSGTPYGYITGVAGYENERVGLVPYTSAAAFRSGSEEYVDSSTPFYVGPGLYRESDGRIHVRLAKTAEMRLVEARYGTVLASENADPRSLGIVLSTASTTLSVSGSYLVFSDLTVHQARSAVSLGSGVHDVTFDGVTLWHGDNGLSVDGSGVRNVTIIRSRVYGDVPLWIAWSDAKDDPAPADRMRGTAIDLAHGARDVRIAWSHVRGGHDGIGVNDEEDGVTVDHSRIENFADDCFELEGSTSVGKMVIHDNHIANCLVAIAPGQDTPVFNGPLLVYRNVIALLRNPFVNRKPGINSWNGGGKYGYEYMFKHGTGSSYSTRNAHYYHNTLIMLNSAGKGLNLTPKYPQDARIANNLAVMINGVVNGAYRTGTGMVWNGDLYWKVNTLDSAPLLSGHDTVGSFSTATGHERNGLGSVPKRGTDPLFATLRWLLEGTVGTVLRLAPGSEVLTPADVLLAPASPAIGAGIAIPPHPALGALPDSRSSRDIGAVPFGTAASAYDVFPYNAVRR
ncbi:MAG TPA: PKD domain-containing protein [Candidatus Polarisedimenticolia bacterium]|nr:PKD domain-containing protein [Candidatus Polarisedimenticolia bacterium]